MTFDQNHYVPCLRWKQGEYQAVLRLSDTAKDLLTPLIEVPEVGFDFETRSDKKTLDAHLASFAGRVGQKWGQRPCFVDLNLLDPHPRMKGGAHPADFIFSALRAEKCHAVPVTGPARDEQYQRAIGHIIRSEGNGLCLRIGLEHAYKKILKNDLDALLATVNTDMAACDLVLDLGAPNFEPLEDFHAFVLNTIDNIPYLNRWRTFTLLGTSFPPTMAEITRPTALVPRLEWQLYTMAVERLKAENKRLPAYGDYAINHPDVLRLDMRLVKPAASIRYTTDEDWFVIKGPNVRDNGFTQYRDHCRRVIDSPYYCGESCSRGDAYIAGCADGREKTGNLTTWRWVGTNHHLEKVARDVSSFHGSSNSA